MAELTVNGKRVQFEAEADTPLLWVLREQLSLTGTKYGCGVAQCGACTVHIDGAPVRTCVLPVGAAQGRQITTIEGLSGPVPEAPVPEGLDWYLWLGPAADRPFNPGLLGELEPLMAEAVVQVLARQQWR